MRRATGVATILAPLLLASTGTVAADALPSLRPMADVDIEWIAPSMRQDGLPMAMQSLRSRRPLDETLARYRTRWSARGDVHVVRRGGWRILVTRLGKHVRTLHLRESLEGVEGVYMVSADPARRTPRPEASLPLPASLEVIRQSSFTDAGRAAESLVLRGRFDVTGESAALLATMRANGWTPTIDEPARHQRGARLLGFARGRESVQAFIASDPRWDSTTLVLLTSIQP